VRPRILLPLRRRASLALLLALGGAGCSADAEQSAPDASGSAVIDAEVELPHADLEEATIEALQEGMRTGKYSARSLTEAYLARIDAGEDRGPRLNAMLDLNPDALQIADSLDAEREAGLVRGPLHGIPLVIKDNIATADRMTTTAGALALEGMIATRDAFIVERLREAGAVIIGKANLSEWANFRSTQSSSGWSGRGGQTKNPYALDRSPCGSSSGTGVAVAANLAVAGVGTETDGSIVCPASANGLVGLKPTMGLVSRAGIVPIAASQDIAGPMTRTVTDAAILLGVLAGEDPRDAATAAAAGNVPDDYARFLDAGGLRGARIGILRRHFTGYSPEADRLFEQAIADLRRAGAILVDSVEIPHYGDYSDAEWKVLQYEFKDGLNRYLANLGAAAPLKSLTEVIRFNASEADRAMPYFGQEILELSQARGPLTDTAYTRAREKTRLAGDGLDQALRDHDLDALIAPTGSPAWTIDLINGDHFLGASSTPAAVAGYPNLTVTMGNSFGLPVGISFIGPAWSEPTLLRLAFAYESLTKHRRAPDFRRTIGQGR
jgi:amidase